jgi:hypothetical protein
MRKMLELVVDVRVGDVTETGSSVIFNLPYGPFDGEVSALSQPLECRKNSKPVGYTFIQATHSLKD